MRIVQLGCGSVGYAIAYAFAEDKVDVEYEIYDFSRLNLAKCAALPLNTVHYEALDLSQEDNIKYALRNADLVIEALPATLGFKVMNISSIMCKNVISISYTREDPLILDENYKRCKRLLIPDAGFAPGISNIVVGRLISLLDRIESIKIYVGGIPEKPIGPLGYSITWSVEDLLDEYVRPARIIENNEIKYVDPLSSVEIVNIPYFNEFEAFYTDGLRTMLHTIRNKVKHAFEKTLRYKGHVEKIRLLRDLGLLDIEPITLEGKTVVPRNVLATLMNKKLRFPGVKDLAILYIDAVGYVNNEKKEYEYLIWSKYDEKRDLSAMAKTTGFTAYAIARAVIDNIIDEIHGVIPPEILGMKENIFTYIMSILVEKDIHLKILD